LPRAEQCGRAQVLQLVRHGADYADSQPVDREDHAGLFYEKRALAVNYICRDDRIGRSLNEFLRLHPAVVEIVIAERSRAEAEQIRNFHDRQAVEYRGYRTALNQVARVQQDAVRAALPLVADGGGEIGKSSLPVIEGLEVGMQIVGVENGERPCLRNSKPGANEREHQGSHGCIPHKFQS